MLFPLLGRVVVLLAQGLERTVPEPLGVAAMTFDVIADETFLQLPLLPAHSAIRFPLQLQRPDRSPSRSEVPRAPALGLV
ncbi:hypothetical protein BJF91_08270 [Allorhizobium taibaishanense]|uniref:Uncharacterized protein n=1 Tax=Allorhizobium taibaishanense TaxID=887144 RepID=A0A1Q9A0P9_9HYPH|nr:hypothetical protein BJF91_08270 [Allorhizobium taibaishanense]